MLLKRLDQSSVVLNLKTGTKDAYDLFQIIKVSFQPSVQVAFLENIKVNPFVL